MCLINPLHKVISYSPFLRFGTDSEASGGGLGIGLTCEVLGPLLCCIPSTAIYRIVEQWCFLSQIKVQ